MNDAITILIFLPLVLLINLCIYKLISSGVKTHHHWSFSTNARQLYLYIICGVGLVMLINGLGQSLINLTNILISDSLVQTSSDDAALGISLLIIGGPLWFYYWRKTHKELTGNSEGLSPGIRNAYFLLVLSVSFAISIRCLFEFFQNLEFNWHPAVTFSIWLLVWIFHARILVKDRHLENIGDQSLRNTFVYTFSLIGLFVLVSNLGSLVYVAISNLIQAEVNDREILLSNTNRTTLNLGISIFLGSVTWFIHWKLFLEKFTKREYESIYLYVIYIVTTIAIMVSGIILLTTILELTFQSNTTDGSTLTIFSSLITFLIAASVLIFHIKNFQNAYLTTELSRTSNEVLIFSLAFLSLVILCSGFSVLIYSMLTSIVQIAWTDLIQPDEFWKEPLSLGISLSVVGGLIWYFCWSRLGSISNAFKKDIRYSRIYFLAVISIAIIFTAGTMTAVTFTLIKGLLANNIGLQTVESLITPLSIGVVISIVGIYHLKIFRHLPNTSDHIGDPKVPNPEPTRKTITIISRESNDSLIEALQRRLGYSAKEIIWAGESDINEDRIQPNVGDLYNSIMDEDDSQILLIQDGDNYRIYPYEKK